MRPPSPARVAEVAPGSPAARAGIAAGDRVLRVNGRAPRDYIEYRYLAAEPGVTLVVERNGSRHRLRLDKHADEDLGLRFTDDVFDGVRTCRNRCFFCFVSQLPPGLRPALYVRDDDYRLSFLHGNFVTLTNLEPADLRRIARLHFSPLYVSVHATEPEVRRRLFGRPAMDGLANLRWLAARGVELHTQIVVCPGVNDNRHLDRTVRELAALYPGVRSIGIVPVGLTRHRRGLPAIRPVGRELAAAIVGQVEAWQREFRARTGSRLVFAADELHLMAGRRVPGRVCYEGFPQLGNGIGGVRLFLDELARVRPPSARRPRRVTLVTGEGAAFLVKRLAERVSGDGVRAEACVVRNRLFGGMVTTAGLLAGRDVARAVARQGAGDLVVVPATAVREGEGFLDGMTVEDLAGQVGAAVATAAGPREAVAAIRAHDRGEGER